MEPISSSRAAGLSLPPEESESASVALAQLYQATTQTLLAALKNASAAQQDMQAVGKAVAASCVRLFVKEQTGAPQSDEPPTTST